MQDIERYLSEKDPRLGKIISKIGRLEIVHYSDPFLFLVKEICGQMISSSVKKIIFERLIILCNGVVSPEEILSHDVDSYRSIGLSRAKVSYIVNLAETVIKGSISFDEISRMRDQEVIDHLTKLKGIGNWTAKMYLLFYLQRLDILPVEDGAFLQVYKWLYNTNDVDPKSVAKRCQKWKPYSSIASRYLYVSLDSGLTKLNIDEFLYSC